MDSQIFVFISEYQGEIWMWSVWYLYSLDSSIFETPFFTSSNTEVVFCSILFDGQQVDFLSGYVCEHGLCICREIWWNPNITMGTWERENTETTWKVRRTYSWDEKILLECSWKNFGEATTQDGHKLYFSGKEVRHENGVGFLVHKDTMKTVMGCQPVSSRLNTIRLRATPFNITVV